MSAAHILVVDDEADIRGLLKEILSEEGYDVDVAGDAGQARASRARQLPDLVLLDIWMPDTDGITLLREWSGSALGDVLPRRDDVGPRHRRDRGRGHASRRVRFRREAAVAAEAAAHRRARAGGRQAKAPRRQVAGRIAGRARRPQPRDAAAARRSRADRRERFAGAAGRRDRHGPRSVRALHPRSEPARARVRSSR